MSKQRESSGAAPSEPVLAAETAEAQSRLRQLIRELDCAEAMIGLANIAQSMETFQRNYDNALKSFDVALSLLERIPLNGELQVAVSKRLTAIYNWLQVVGPGLTPQ